jgi:hypothetical protein
VSRHEADFGALLAGLVFVAVGIAYLFDVRPDFDVDGRWILPLVLIGLGLAGLAGTLRRRPSDHG